LSRQLIANKARLIKAIAAIRELRKLTGKISLDELLSARDEGRKS
jgi:hypothetical protein